MLIRSSSKFWDKLPGLSSGLANRPSQSRHGSLCRRSVGGAIHFGNSTLSTNFPCYELVLEPGVPRQITASTSWLRWQFWTRRLRLPCMDFDNWVDKSLQHCAETIGLSLMDSWLRLLTSCSPRMSSSFGELCSGPCRRCRIDAKLSIRFRLKLWLLNGMTTFVNLRQVLACLLQTWPRYAALDKPPKRLPWTLTWQSFPPSLVGRMRCVKRSLTGPLDGTWCLQLFFAGVHLSLQPRHSVSSSRCSFKDRSPFNIKVDQWLWFTSLVPPNWFRTSEGSSCYRL